VLVLGLTHNWFAITADAAVHTQGLFLITWLVIIVLLTATTLRLPLAFTAIFVLVDLALLAVLIGTLSGSAGWLKIGGVLAFLFAAVGAYVYAGVAALATGGGAMNLGRPVLAG
jgi:succinate-acetate transporter protein